MRDDPSLNGDPPPSSGVMSWRERVWRPSWAGVIGVLVVAMGVVAGADRLRDNSFLTHLATGRLILDEGSVPTTDPYSFTAPGEPWVVQSWLASVVYAVAERLAGGDGIRLLVGLATGVVALILWTLTRPAGGVVARLAVATAAFTVGAATWTPRPYVFGLVAIGAALLALEGRVRAPWLVAVGWLWVNTHGSFPLGLVVAGAYVVGTWADRERPHREIRCLAWLGGGILLGALNPIGPRILTFPVTLLGRYDLLGSIQEWRAPSFEALADRTFLVLGVLFIAGLVRRPSWRRAIPGTLFLFAGVVSARNLVVGSMVLVAATTPAFHGLGTLRSDARLRRGAIVAAAGLLALGAVLVDRLQEPAFAVERPYPVRSLALIEQAGVDLRDARLIAPERVGNLRTLLEGPTGSVYFDDRFDMYPVEDFRDYLVLMGASPGWRDVLDRVDSQLVLVPLTSALGQVLLADGGWRVVMLDSDLVLLCPRGAGPSELGCDGAPAGGARAPARR